MEKTDTTICLKKKKNKTKRISKKLSRGKKSLNIITHKIVSNYDLIVYTVI